MLIRCTDCDAEISDKAEACINCGCPVGPSKKETFRDTFKRSVAEARKTETARMIAKKVYFWKANFVAIGVFFVGYIIYWNVVLAPESTDKVSSDTSGHVLLWILIAWFARGMYLVLKTREYDKLPAEELRKVWLELGGFSPANENGSVAGDKLSTSSE